MLPEETSDAFTALCSALLRAQQEKEPHALLASRPAGLSQEEQQFLTVMVSYTRLLDVYNQWELNSASNSLFRCIWRSWQKTAPADIEQEWWFRILNPTLRRIFNTGDLSCAEIGERVPPYIDHVVKLAS